MGRASRMLDETEFRNSEANESLDSSAWGIKVPNNDDFIKLEDGRQKVLRTLRWTRPLCTRGGKSLCNTEDLKFYQLGFNRREGFDVYVPTDKLRPEDSSEAAATARCRGSADANCVRSIMVVLAFLRCQVSLLLCQDQGFVKDLFQIECALISAMLRFMGQMFCWVGAWAKVLRTSGFLL